MTTTHRLAELIDCVPSPLRIQEVLFIYLSDIYFASVTCQATGPLTQMDEGTMLLVLYETKNHVVLKGKSFSIP